METSKWLQYDQSDDDSEMSLAEQPLPIFEHLEVFVEEIKKIAPKPTKPPIPSNNKYSIRPLQTEEIKGSKAKNVGKKNGIQFGDSRV